jgi:exonuclease SbcD
MRFIHTADWHLGNQMHDINRFQEMLSFFQWLKNQIIEKKAEVLLVSGDIFDTVNPSMEARQLYYDFLASLKDSPCKTVVITGGNHDSAAMLETSKAMLKLNDIHVIGSINNLQAQDMVIELNTSDGKKALCLAVPFVREIELRNLVPQAQDSELYTKAYTKLYSDVYQAALKKAGKDKFPLIVMGHLYAANLEGRLSGAPSNTKTDDGMKILDTVGSLGNVPSSVFPEDADYVALGHIHYTTTVGKNPKIRYSGSPFVMGFDEASYPHYVLCVDVDGESPAKVEKLEVPLCCVYQRLEGSLDAIKAQIKSFSKLQSPKAVYLELCYKRETGVNAQDFLDEDVKNLPENIKVVSWKIFQKESNTSYQNYIQDYTSDEIKNLDDEEIFRQLIISKMQLDPESPEVKAALEKFLPLFMAEVNS